MARSRNRCHPFNTEDLARLWLLRMLVPLGLHRKFFGKSCVNEDAIALALGLDTWLDIDSDEYHPATLLVELRRLHAQAERTHARPSHRRYSARTCNTLRIWWGWATPTRDS